MQKPIVLENLVLYNTDQKPERIYRQVELSSERIGLEFGEMYNAPSSALLYAIIENLHDLKHPDYFRIKRDLSQGSVFSTGTSISYGKNEITHVEKEKRYTTEFQILVRERIMSKYDILKSKKMVGALQALLMPKDLDKALSLLLGKRKQFRFKAPDVFARGGPYSYGIRFQVDSDTFVIHAGDTNSTNFYRCTREVRKIK